MVARSCLLITYSNCSLVLCWHGDRNIPTQTMRLEEYCHCNTGKIVQNENKNYCMTRHIVSICMAVFIVRNQCKRYVTPVLKHWSYVSFALTLTYQHGFAGYKMYVWLLVMLYWFKKSCWVHTFIIFSYHMWYKDNELSKVNAAYDIHVTNLLAS